MNILGARPCPTPWPRVHYLPKLTEEHKAIHSSVNGGICLIFYVSPILAASSDGEPPKQVSQDIQSHIARIE
jgi:hypothetical protein